MNMKEKKSQEEENAFQKVREDKSDVQNPQEVPDKTVNKETRKINPDENTVERG